MASLLSLSSDLLSRCNAFNCLPAFAHSIYIWSLKFNLLSTITPRIVMLSVELTWVSFMTRPSSASNELVYTFDNSMAWNLDGQNSLDGNKWYPSHSSLYEKISAVHLTLSFHSNGIYCFPLRMFPLHWRHNDHDGVSNHQPHGCLLNRLFRRRLKKTSKLRITGLCVGNSPGPVNSTHKGPVMRKMVPFDDVIMQWIGGYWNCTLYWQ